MRALLLSLLLAPGQDPLPPAPGGGPEDPVRVAGTREAAAPADPRGPGLELPLGVAGQRLFVPRQEELVYQVLLSVGSAVDVDVGTFTLTAGVEPFRRREGAPDLAADREGRAVEGGDAGEDGPLSAWIRAHGAGTYLGFRVDHSLEARYLPQAWPSILHREVEAGTQGRRRELMYGLREGRPWSWYRTNHHCSGCERPEHHVERSLFSPAGHCADCGRGEHRVWAAASQREAPAGAVDMLGALHLLRAQVRADDPRRTVPVLQKDGHWDVTLILGEGVQEQVVPAGTFPCRPVKVDPRDGDGEGLKANLRPLFGPDGDLTLWVDAASGIPVHVVGVVDVGPLDLGLRIQLLRASGTPPGFGER